MDWSRLDTLKELTCTATRFADVWDYFFDHFAESKEFIALGRPLRGKRVAQLVAVIGQQCFRRPVSVTQALLIEVPGRSFIHGSGWIDGQLMGVFYFPDVGLGMLSVCRRGGDTLMARFGVISVVPEKQPTT